jgi:tripartite-type tricarboxylate transporter receptor subunit TctC
MPGHLATTRRGAVLGLLAAGAASRARAQAPAWPTRGIRLLVGYPAGGANDFVVRTVATPLSEALGQPIVVENRTGAAGGIAAEAAAKATPDGYTLFSLSSAHVLAPSVRKSVPFDPVKDFTPIVMLARSPYFLMVHQSVPARTVAEFVALAKSKPGELAYASSGVGAGPHLTTSLFMHVAGIRLEHVPYRGDADALIDLTSGRVPCAFLSVAPAIPHIQAGTLRALAVSGAERLSLMPDVPTVAESGYPGFAMDAWWSIAGPAGLPPSVVSRVAAATQPILDSPATAARYLTAGVVPAKLAGPEAFAAFVRQDRVRLDEIARAAGIEPQD